MITQDYGVAPISTLQDANLSWSTTDAYTPYLSDLTYGLPLLITVCCLLSLIILSTIVGNIFVISAILLEKSLRAMSNYLILSLAVTDLMVAILVMPISIFDEINKKWKLGAEICDMWVSFDVLCCTASILHLVAIALDRYWSVTNVDYTRKRSPVRILVMIALVWFISFSVSVPPLLGWRQPSNSSHNTSQCIISQDLGYTIYSTVGAFYIPLILILALNYKIYVVARGRLQRCLEKKGVLRAALQAQRASVTMLVGGNGPECPPSQVVDTTNFKSDIGILNQSQPVKSSQPGNANLLSPNMYLAPNFPNKPRTDSVSVCIEASIVIQSDAPSSIRPHTNQTSTILSGGSDNADTTYAEGYVFIPDSSSDKTKSSRQRRLLLPEIKKEKKTASVLGIITGAFIFCWLPFFIVALVRPSCGKVCDIPDTVLTVILWLGYVNSMINPIIYTIFNPNFRAAFRRLYCSNSKKPKQALTSRQL